MLLDSNILIGYLNGDPIIGSTLRSWREAGAVLFISHISVIEILSYPTLSAQEIVAIEDFLSDFIVIPLDMQVSRHAAEIRRLYKLLTPDAIIVGSAIANNLPLATRDKKIRTIPGILHAEI